MMVWSPSRPSFRIRERVGGMEGGSEARSQEAYGCGKAVLLGKGGRVEIALYIYIYIYIDIDI